MYCRLYLQTLNLTFFFLLKFFAIKASAKLFCLMKIERLKNVIARQEPKRRENKSHVLTMQGPHGLFEIEDPNRTEAFVEVQEFGKEEHELRKFQWIISNKSMFLLILIISTPSIIAISSYINVIISFFCQLWMDFDSTYVYLSQWIL